MNTNTEYEKFTQEVCERLALYQGISSSVQHNVKLKGKSGLEHQVDVFWEYEKDGNVHRVAIECKNYNQKISIGRVRDFFGVLYDVGNIKGVMACKKGYQEGAKKFADYYNITLEELREPQEGETIIGEFDWHFEADVTRCLFLVDEEWAQSHKFDIQGYREKQDMLSFNGTKRWSKSTHLSLDRTDDFIRDAKGKVLRSIDDFHKRVPDKQPDANTDIYCLKDSYVNNKYWGLMKINEIKFERENIRDDKTYAIDAGVFAKAILKDALNGDKMVVMDW
jgi:hypothetical protein